MRWTKFSSQQELDGVTGGYGYRQKADGKGNLFDQSRHLKGASERQNRQILLILAFFRRFWLVQRDSYDPCFTVLYYKEGCINSICKPTSLDLSKTEDTFFAEVAFLHITKQDGIESAGQKSEVHQGNRHCI